MSTVEDTLARTGRDIREAADQRRLPRWRKGRRRPVVRVAWASLFLVAAVAVGMVWTRGTAPSELAAPERFGTWREMAEAPIAPRPIAVSVWTGTEALFWAGASLDRSFAYTDGSAYDPNTDTWRAISVPGWGHPGLTGVFFDGSLYALAKGGGTTFDPETGSWVDLPQAEGMLLSAAVATDDAVWGLGSALLNPQGQPDIAIARLDSAQDRWVYGPVYEGTPELGSIFEDVMFTHQPVLWTGSEIVAWNGRSAGLAFDPSTETWDHLAIPVPGFGTVTTSVATVANGRLVVVAGVDVDGESTLGMAVQTDGVWTWRQIDIEIEDFAALTVAPASDWIVLFIPDQAPITLHVPSGAWSSHPGGPLAGLSSPNTVWTGDELIIWGGAGSATESTPNPAEGAIWTPPTSEGPRS